MSLTVWPTDASLQVYGAVMFVLQGTHSTIAISKSRAAPLKPHFLPRLELQFLHDYAHFY